MAKAKQVIRILTRENPTKLTKHMTSLQVYGEQADEGFDESIAKRGVDEPIVVAADGKTIISGVRRRNGAMKAGIKEVPILHRKDLTDDLDIREAIIEANRHNEQSTEVKARAFRVLKEIEELRAKKRLKTSTGGAIPRPTANLPEAGKGESRQKAAEKVGMGARTAEKASEVVDAIDAAEASGDTKKSQELRETLNNKSVAAAHKQVAKKKAAKDKPPKQFPRSHWLKQWESSIGPLVRLVDKIASEVMESKSSSHQSVQKHLNAATDKMHEWIGKK